MAKSNVHAVDAQDDATTFPMPAETPSESPLGAIATRFSRRDEAALANGGTLREVYRYADESVCFGNGQWPNVPAHFDPAGLDTRKALIALALDTARGAGAPIGDDDLSAIVKAAEDKLANGASSASLLEQALNYGYFYSQIQALPKEEKKARGINAELKNIDGSLMTNFGQRMALVDALLSLKGDSGRGPKAGAPMHGQTWLDVVGDTIRAYVTESNPKNKKQDKAEKEAKAAKPSGKSAFESIL